MTARRGRHVRPAPPPRPPRPARARRHRAARATAPAAIALGSLLAVAPSAAGQPPLATALAALAAVAPAPATPGAGSPTSNSPRAANPTGDSVEPLVNDEVVLATLDPTGLPEHALLISRVAATGPARELLDPASLTNVRYLDRLGRPETAADGVLLTVGGDRPSALTQARFDKPLPLALHAEYTLDGTTVAATDVPGSDATVGVTYTLTNTTSLSTDLRFTDAAGATATETRPVFAPFQGTLTATLPEGAALVDDGGAMLATDDQGRTVARWNLALYPPISPPVQQVGFAMRAGRAGIPEVRVELTPADLDQDPEAGFSADLLAGATDGNADLYSGLAELDAGAGTLASGSERLADGLGSLAGGAGAAAGAAGALAGGIDDLSTGARTVADASRGLADGVADVAGGADALAGGTGALAGALGRASTGADALAEATAELAASTAAGSPDPVAPLIAGGEQIEDGLALAAARVGSPDDPVLSITTPLPPDGDEVCPPGGVAPPDDDCVTIYQGVRQLRDGLVVLNAVADAIEARAEDAQAALDQLLADLEDIRDDVTTAAEGAAALWSDLCGPPTPTLDPDSCARLQAVAEAAGDALATGAGALPTVEQIEAAIEALVRQGQAIAAAIDLALASTNRLLAGIAELGLALGDGTATEPGLGAGMAALNAGLRDLRDGLAEAQRQLTAALTEVATGNATLAAGLGDAAAGADDLAAGSADLAAGAELTADGASDLAGGADQLAGGAQDASAGADRVARGVDDLAAGADAAAAAGAEVAGGARDLQQEGTAPAAATVLDASTDPALASAWLAAASDRAADALPYGPPQGGVGNVAYVFTIEPVAAPRSLWQRILDVFR